jgi:hypothetical protein
MRLRALMLLTVTLLGCGTTTPTKVFAGPIDQSDIVIGVVIHGSSVALYSCGGASTYATASRWFIGSLDTGTFSLTKEGWTATGVVSDAKVTGTLVSPDHATTLTWSTPLYADNDGSGLYEVVATGGCMTGVVVWSAGGTLKTQGTWCDGSGSFEQVIPVTPAEVKATGFAIDVPQSSGPDLYLTVSPASVLVGG